MLPVKHRVRTATDFARTVRSGARSGRRNVVLYGVGRPDGGESRVGFIVGKNVGNAVTRNLVKRRLRHLAAAWIAEGPEGFDVVVRALPAAAAADLDILDREFRSAVGVLVRKLNATKIAAGDSGVS